MMANIGAQSEGGIWLYIWWPARLLDDEGDREQTDHDEQHDGHRNDQVPPEKLSGQLFEGVIG